VWTALREGRAEDALANYHGELLAALFASDSEGFQRWLETERARLKVEVSRAALALALSLEREGRLAAALSAAQRAIEIQPDDETAVRRLITLHDVIGDRAGALAVFETYRSRLAAEFEAEPAPETLALANRLRASTGSSAARTKPLPVKGNRIASKFGAVPQAAEVASVVAVDSGLPIDSRRRFPRTGVAAMLVLGLMLLIGWAMSRPRPISIGTSAPLTSEEGLQIEPAISPNGRLVAYAKGNAIRMRVFVQKIAGGSPWALTVIPARWRSCHAGLRTTTSCSFWRATERLCRRRWAGRRASLRQGHRATARCDRHRGLQTATRSPSFGTIPSW
jgi:tetratricopeptide (TPR) repeat protein